MPDEARNDEALARLRAEIAQALHDGPCQTLTGVNLLTHVVAQRLQRDNSPERAREVAELGELVGRALGELNTVLTRLRPHASPESENAGR